MLNTSAGAEPEEERQIFLLQLRQDSGGQTENEEGAETQAAQPGITF